MNDIILTTIHPSILGKIKPYQNLTLIILCIILLAVFTLSWFDNKVLISIVGGLIVLSGVLMLIFILLSLPFLLFKRLEIAIIRDGILTIYTGNKPSQYDVHNLTFVLNINRRHTENEVPLNPEMADYFLAWGNYIVISSEGVPNDIRIQFIPDKDLYKLVPQINIEIHKSRSILMNDTTDLLKNIIWMLWGAS